MRTKSVNSLPNKRSTWKYLRVEGKFVKVIFFQSNRSSGVIYYLLPYCDDSLAAKRIFLPISFQSNCADILGNADFVPAAKGNKGIIIRLYQKSGRDFVCLQHYN